MVDVAPGIATQSEGSVVVAVPVDEQWYHWFTVVIGIELVTVPGVPEMVLAGLKTGALGEPIAAEVPATGASPTGPTAAV